MSTSNNSITATPAGANNKRAKALKGVALVVLLGLAFSRMAGAIGWVKRNYEWVMRIGGGMLIVVGVLLVTGLWTDFTIWLRVQVPGFETPL